MISDWFATGHKSRPSARIALFVIAVLAVGLAGLDLYEIWSDVSFDERPLGSALRENVLPLLLALALLPLAWWLGRRQKPPFLWTMAKSAVAGFGLALLFAGVIGTIQLLQGTLKPVDVVTQVAAFGVALGLLVGFAYGEVKKARDEAVEARRRAERENALLRLTQEVTTTANEAESIEVALQEATDAVCEHTGWPVGHVYWLRPGGSRPLVSSGIWCLPASGKPGEGQSDNGQPGEGRLSEKHLGGGHFETFRSVTEEANFDVGESLPGRVADRGEPAWIEDVTEDPHFVRKKMQTGDLGVRGAFAVPVQVGKKTIAVLEFFSSQREERDDELMEAIRSVGVQLSRVAEREETQAALEESEQKFRALAEQSLIGIELIQDGVYEYVNSTFAEIFGYSQEELVGQSPETVFHPDDWPEVEKKIERRLADEKEEARFTARGLTRSGETTYLQVYGKRIHYRGRPAIVGASLDVTEETKAKTALRESKERFRSLTENAPIGISMLGKEGYLYANPAFGKIFGYEPEEILGKYPKDLYHPADWPTVRRWTDEVLAGKREAVQGQTRATTKTGETRHVEIFAAPATYREKPALVWGVIDITERKELQQKIVQVQEEERRRIGQDLHDGVASQLTGVNLMLTNLSRRFEAEGLAEQIEKVQTLVKQSAVEVRRLSHGLSPSGLSRGDLQAALEELAQSTGDVNIHFDGVGNEQKACELEVSNLKASDLEETVATHLYRIAQEAVANASKYAEATEVEVRLRQEGGALVLEIDDDGTGFDPEETEEGLGLRSMRHRAELLGAELTVDSEPGEGTVVSCRLPT